MAYMGQAAAVYETLRRTGSASVSPHQCDRLGSTGVTRMLRKYDMAFPMCFAEGISKAKGSGESSGVEVFDGVRDRMIAELESLRSAVRDRRSDVRGAIDTSRQKVLHQIEGLRTKFINAEARRNETLERHLGRYREFAFP